jgi:hypothetical protein
MFRGRARKVAQSRPRALAFTLLTPSLQRDRRTLRPRFFEANRSINNHSGGITMIKNIALAGIFVVVSAFSVSHATALTTARPSGKVMAPIAPVGQALCPVGVRC